MIKILVTTLVIMQCALTACYGQDSIAHKKKLFTHTIQFGSTFSKIHAPYWYQAPWSSPYWRYEPIAPNMPRFTHRVINDISYSLIYKNKISLNAELTRYELSTNPDMFFTGLILTREYSIGNITLGYVIRPSCIKRSYVNIQAGYGILSGYDIYLDQLSSDQGMQYKRNVSASAVLGRIQFNYNVWRFVSASAGVSYNHYFNNTDLLMVNVSAGVTL